MNGFRVIKRVLEPYPRLRALVKRIYQLSGYVMSDKSFHSTGIDKRVSPEDDSEYFFGYYDKSPWDGSGRLMLATKVGDAYKAAESDDECTICLIDTIDSANVKNLCISHSWNVQQGCMVQWLGPDFRKRIIYNDFRKGVFCSLIYNIENNKEEKELPMPIYDISKDGSFALTLDFTRLHYLRRGYGYPNLARGKKIEKCPDDYCIWRINIDTGEVTGILKYTDLAAFDAKDTMQGAYHKVNHIMINPCGNRFMVIHRWILKGKKYSRLVTANIDGTELYNLSDDTFVSHCFWKNDNEIIAFLRKNESGDHYYLMSDKTKEYRLMWPELRKDGHCSFSHDGKLVVTDTYPNAKRISTLYICNPESGEVKTVAKVFAPFRYDNDVRCDLHPRWSRDDTEICIDSAHEGKKEMYIVRVK